MYNQYDTIYGSLGVQIEIYFKEIHFMVVLYVSYSANFSVLW